MTKLNNHQKLLLGFFRAGILGFGGGVACLPLLKREAVDNFNWMTDDEFSEVVAISNTLPGPINTKMAGYIGYKVAGVSGATVAVSATVLPSVLLLVFLLGILTTYRTHPVVAGMTNAIVPVVGVMLGLMAWQFLKSASKEWKWAIIALNVIIVYVLIAILGWHPAIVVIAMILLALFKPTPKQNLEKGGEDRG